MRWNPFFVAHRSIVCTRISVVGRKETGRLSEGVTFGRSIDKEMTDALSDFSELTIRVIRTGYWLRHRLGILG
jgi:hypothetical protein